MPQMYLIVWRYEVRPERRADFERHYGTDGTWAKFFARANGYQGSELYRDIAWPLRFITIDRWESENDFRSFGTENREEYGRIDSMCEDLTLLEERIAEVILED